MPKAHLTPTGNMFLRKYEETVSPYALPGLLNDFKLNLKQDNLVFNLDRFLEIVIEETGITEEQLKSRKRTREYVIARQIFCYLAKKHTLNTLSSIGSYLGDRDHTTIIHSINTMSDLLQTDRNLEALMMKIESRITKIEHPKELAYTVIKGNFENMRLYQEI